MIALLNRVKRLCPPSVPPRIGRLEFRVWSFEFVQLETRNSKLETYLSRDQRGATLVTYVLVLPLLILLIFGSFAVWRIMAIRQTLFLGTYKAAWELSQQARDTDVLPFDEDEWREFAEFIIRTEVEGNHLIITPTLNVTVTLPIELACPPDDPNDPRPINDILFTVEATLSLPTPIRIPFLDPESITLTEQHTSFVECPRVWKGTPPPEEHIY